MKNKIVIVGGSTASGKTDLALKVAKEFNGELINADSRQIYKYLDVGTNKGTPPLSAPPLCQRGGNRRSRWGEFPVHSIAGVPIHLLSFLDPDQKFDVFTYQKLVYELIEDIEARGKLPILVGGTGLYIDAVLKGYELNEGLRIKNEELGKGLRSELNQLSIDELHARLEAIDKQLLENLNDSDKKNPRRLLRLIEKNELRIKDEGLKGEPTKSVVGVLSSLFLYPSYDWEQLKQKIDARVVQMFEQGLVEESKHVLGMGFSKDSVALQGIGYRQVLEYLDGKITLDECIKLVQIAHRQYAKRQRTWFEGKGRNYDLVRVDGFDQAEKAVRQFLG